MIRSSVAVAILLLGANNACAQSTSFSYATEETNALCDTAATDPNEAGGVLLREAYDLGIGSAGLPFTVGPSWSVPLGSEPEMFEVCLAFEETAGFEGPEVRSLHPATYLAGACLPDEVEVCVTAVYANLRIPETMAFFFPSRVAPWTDPQVPTQEQIASTVFGDYPLVFDGAGEVTQIDVGGVELRPIDQVPVPAPPALRPATYVAFAVPQPPAIEAAASAKLNDLNRGYISALLNGSGVQQFYTADAALTYDLGSSQVVVRSAAIGQFWQDLELSSLTFNAATYVALPTVTAGTLIAELDTVSGTSASGSVTGERLVVWAQAGDAFQIVGEWWRRVTQP